MKSFLCEGCMLASSGDSLPKIPNIFFKKHKGVINTFIHLIVFLSQLVLIVRSTTGSGAGLFERAGPSGLALNENYPPRPDGRGYPMSPLRGLPIENTSDAWRPEPAITTGMALSSSPRRSRFNSWRRSSMVYRPDGAGNVSAMFRWLAPPATCSRPYGTFHRPDGAGNAFVPAGTEPAGYAN